MYEIVVKDDVFDREIGRLMDCLKTKNPDDKEYALITKAVKTLESMKVEEANIKNEHAKAKMAELKEDFDRKVRDLELKFKEMQHEDELRYRELELDMREKHHEEDLNERAAEAAMRKRMDTIRLCIEIAGLVLPLIFCWTWMSRGLAFEETHVFTSTTFRGLMNKFTGLFV